MSIRADLKTPGSEAGLLSQKDMTFIVSPPDISFHSFQPHKKYEASLTFKNQTSCAKFVRLLPPESRFFSISEPRAGSNSLKVAAGLSVTYSVYFKPEEDTDYQCELVAVTEGEKFVVPVVALGSRGRLMFPPLVHFPSAPVKATSRSTVLITNVGHKASEWRAVANPPFALVPQFGRIEPAGDAQVVVEFTPTALQHFESTIVFDLGNRDSQSMRVSGDCVDVEIMMSPDVLVIPKTFISLERQGIVRVTNNSDATVQYCWKAHGSEEEEHSAQASKTKGKGLRERKLSAVGMPLLFDDIVFTIEPIQGQVAAKGTREFVVTFNPQLATQYCATAHLDIQGKRDRIPLTIKGTGLGPQCGLSFDSLDLGDIYINSVRQYEVILENRGSIEAKYALMPQQTLFGPKFRFSPGAASIAAGDRQTIQISFCSDIIGIVSETFHFHVQGSTEELELHFKGRVIGPTFHFDVEELDYGNVSYNFWHSKHFNLVNTSEIPMQFHLRVPEDGPDSKKEFDVIPPSGCVLPHGSKQIQVDFLSNTVQEYNAHLVVDIDEVGDNLDSLPIKATCVVPEVVVSCDALDYGHCFVGYRYSKEVELRNDTALSAKYEFILPAEDDPIRKKAEVVIGSGDLKERKGIVHARSTQRIHVFFTARMTGNIHLPLFVRVLGSDRAPHHIQISSRVTGPKIEVQPKTLDFGVLEVLSEVPKPIVIANDSPIPAFFSAKLTAKQPPNVHPPFSLKVAEGSIKPQSTTHLHVTAFLDEAMRFSDELVITVQNNTETESVNLLAIGKGFTLIPSIKLDPVDFGDQFTTVPLKKVFTVYNKGRRPQSIQWNNERGKAKEGEQPVIFTIGPERATINGKSEETFTIEGLSNQKGVFSERFLCKVSQTHKLVFKAVVQANFQPPLLQYSSNQLQFSYEYNPEGEQAFVSSRPLTMKNASPLDLEFSLKIGKIGEVHPFSLDQSDFQLKRGESTVVNIQFDASYRGDRISHKLSTKMIVSFANHSQKDSITLNADLQFPNLKMDSNSVEFGCILNDMETRKMISVTNVSRGPATFTWIFEEEDPTAAAKRRGQEGLPSIPINSVFDLIPFRGVIPPNATENIEVLFCGIPGRKFAATAICQVEGGPDYPLSLSGEASSIHYRFDRVALDFGMQEYDKWEEKDVTITNTGKVPFPFQVDLSFMSRPGMVEVVPMSGTVTDKVKLSVRFSPRVPDRIDDFFRIQAAHFEPQIINVKGVGLYSSISVAPVGNVAYVMRNDPSNFKQYLAEAKLKLSQPDYKPYNVGLTKTGEPIVDPVLAEAERLYFRDIITEDVMLMKSIAMGEGVAQSTERVASIKRQTSSGDTKYLLSRYILDLGNIVKGEARKRSFKITNSSTTQISFAFDRRTLANSGISVAPEKFPKVPVHGQVSVDVTLNSKLKNIAVGPFSAETLIDIKNGPLVILEVRASIVLPTIELSTDHVDFGTVLVGMQRIICISIENTQPLPCEWSAASQEVELRKRAEKHGKFICEPTKGVLQPQQKTVLQLSFIPAISETISQKILIRLAANPKIFEIHCTGIGEELQFEVNPSEIDLPPVFPYQNSRRNFQLVNKSSVPVEVFSHDFDQRYLVEEDVLRNAEEFFEKDILLLPPREVGSSLPDFLMESYFQKLMEADSRYAAADIIPEVEGSPGPIEPEQPPTVTPSIPLPPLEIAKVESEAPKPFVVAITGPPMSGKTTQTQRIAEKYQLLEVSLDRTIRNTAEMDTLEGSILRSLLSKQHGGLLGVAQPGSATPQVHTPSQPEKGKDAKGREQSVALSHTVSELTPSLLTSIIKQRLKNQDAVNGVVVDDLACCLTPNAEMILQSFRDAAQQLGIPFSVVSLSMDELLISLRHAEVAQRNAEEDLQNNMVNPLTEDEYDRLDDNSRLRHDLALKRFRDCRKVLRQTTEKVENLKKERSALKAAGKLPTIVEEMEKEAQDQLPEETKGKKAPAKKQPAASATEAPVVARWDELTPINRYKRIFTTCKTLLDPTAFAVVPSDGPIEEIHTHACEILPVPKEPEPSNTMLAPTAESAEVSLRPPTAEKQPDFTIPEPCTKQRIEHPKERREIVPVKYFKILTPISPEKLAQAAAAPLPPTGKTPDPRGKARRSDSVMAVEQPSKDPFTEEPRWVIQPNSSVELVLQFCSEENGDISRRLSFGIVGSHLEFPLVCRTSSAYPEIIRDVKTIFTRRVRGKGEKIHKEKGFNMSKKMYDFGALLVLPATKAAAAAAPSSKKEKLQHQVAASQEPVVLKEYPGGVNSEKLQFKNTGLFPVEVSLVMELEKERSFGVQPDNFTLPAGETTTVTLLAVPDRVGEISNSLIVCIKDNPEPLRIDLTCLGSRPEVTVAGKKDFVVDFGRLLLRRKEERKVPFKNNCALPVRWKILGAEKLPAEFKIDNATGVLDVEAECQFKIAFVSERANTFNIPLKVEISDVDGTNIYEALPLTLKAEAHDVVLEWTKELDFKTVRVAEAKKETIKLLNKGPYEVQYMFRLPKRLQDHITVNPLEGTLRGMLGLKEAQINQVDVTFKSDREVQIGKRGADIEVVFVEPTLKELVYPPQKIQVRAEALFSKFQIKPMHINFGPCLYRQKKHSTFDIVNTGCFDLKYRLYSFRDGPGKELTAPPEQTPAKKQAEKRSKKEVVDLSEMQLGAFSLSPSVAVVPVGGTQTVSVGIMPEGSNLFHEILGIHIDDADPAVAREGIAFDLEAESCVPAIISDLDSPDSDTIFEEQQIVARLDGFRKMASVFSREEKVFSFGVALSGRRLAERFRLTNPVKVPCTVHLQILPRGDTPDAKASAEAFDIQGAKFDGGRLTIPPHEHRYVTVGFTASSLNTYCAYFEASIEAGADAKVKPLRFELRGEGSLPNLSLEVPPPPAKIIDVALQDTKPTKGQKAPAGKNVAAVKEEEKYPPNTLVLPRTIIGHQSSRSITVRNVGELPATIRFHFPMTTQTCFSFPSRNEDLTLIPGAVEKYSVFFEPTVIGEFRAKLSMNVADNHYEDAVITVIGEGYSEPLSFGEVDENTENRLTLSDCYVGRTTTKTFEIRSNSSVPLRFTWTPASPSIRCTPKCGHLPPGGTKLIQCVFESSAPITETVKCGVSYQPIRYESEPKIMDWDDTMVAFRWVSESPRRANPEDVNDDGETPPVSARTALRRKHELVSEPAYAPIPDAAPGTKDLFVAVVCDYTSYDVSFPQGKPEAQRLIFKQTKLFEIRTVPLLVKNTGKVMLPFEFAFTKDDLSPLDEDEYDCFSIFPHAGAISPGESRELTLNFSPKTVGDHFQLLNGNFLYGPKAQYQLQLVGSSDCPLVHFELPPSEYFNRRDTDLPPTDTSAVVVEFFSRGIKIRNTVRFMAVNPSNMGYDFEWTEHPVPGQGISPFKCNTPKGSIHSGKKFEMVFEFTPENLKLRESSWSFTIVGHTTITFLFVGRASEPEVYFNFTKINFGQVIVGAKSKQSVTIENREMVAYPFHFEKLAPTAAITINPLSGVVPPNGSLPVDVVFTPTSEETYNYTLFCRVRKAVSPITCNVKGEGYTTQESMRMQSPDGQILPLSPSQPNTIQLGVTQVNGKITRKFILSNQGRYNLDYKWIMPHHPFVTLSPMIGNVLPNSDSAIQLTYAPTKESSLSDLKLTCKITNANSYTVLLNSSSKAPNVTFSWKEMDFGPCFVYTGSTDIPSSILTVTNKDPTSTIIDCLYDNKEHLEIDVSSFVLQAQEKRDIRFQFLPRDSILYNETITFSINGLTTTSVQVRGEGTLPKIEIPNRQVRFGTIRIGERRDVEVRVVCKSKIPTAFSLEKCLPPELAKLGVTVSPEHLIFLKPKETKIVTFSCRPQVRMRPFSHDMKMIVVGQEAPFASITGSFQGSEVHLDVKQLAFGSVVVNTRVSKRVTIMNTGDIGLEFTWNDKKLGADYTITPATGFIQAHSEEACEVSYHPTEVGSDGKRENVEVRFSEAPPLAISVVNSNCIEKPNVADVVHFTCRVRETTTAKVTVRNDTADPWNLKPSIDNSVWSGPESLVVRAKESADYMITYAPQVCTKLRLNGENDIGTLFFPLPTGTALLFRLEGTSDVPNVAAPTIDREVTAKVQHVERLVVSNWLKEPQRFSVSMKWSHDPNDDSAVIKGVSSLDVPAESTRDFKLSFFAYKEGKITGTVHFTNEHTREYQFYSLAFNVKAPKEVATIELKTQARVRKATDITVTNPLAKQVTLVTKIDNPDIMVQPSVVLPPKGSVKVQIEFFPLIVREYPPTKLVLSCPELGDFPYSLQLAVSPPPPEKPIRMQCSLGQLTSTSLRFNHHCKAATDFQFKFSDPKQTAFIKSNGQMVIKVNACSDVRVGQEVVVDVTFEPCRVGEFRETVEISSPVGGQYIFNLQGTCTPPQRQGPIEIRPNQSAQIPFKNVYNENVTFTFATDQPQFSVAKATEVIPGKKSTVIAVSYRCDDQNVTVRGKLTVSAQSSSDATPAQWIYYLRGMKGSEVEALPPAPTTKKGGR